MIDNPKKNMMVKVIQADRERNLKAFNKHLWMIGKIIKVDNNETPSIYVKIPFGSHSKNFWFFPEELEILSAPLYDYKGVKK